MVEVGALAALGLERLGITADDVRARMGGSGSTQEVATNGEIPFTPRVKKVFELATREAMGMHHLYVAPEHILFGLAREGGGDAARILEGLGAPPQRVATALYSTFVSMPPPDYLESFPSRFGEPGVEYELRNRPWCTASVLSPGRSLP